MRCRLLPGIPTEARVASVVNTMWRSVRSPRVAQVEVSQSGIVVKESYGHIIRRVGAGESVPVVIVAFNSGPTQVDRLGRGRTQLVR
ncbi:MAG: hypothetical protein BMS9Abin12_2127 [Acidimicrobiia bacterium]|nr:MAG: hypothetical protein BMS9Abin12_2127 [Acidimicrobiia bacterium]